MEHTSLAFLIINTSSSIFEEFLWNLKKYISSKKYFKNWRLFVLLDNASYHKSKNIVDKLNEMKVNVWYLPSCTPRFQSVEYFFGIAKSKLRGLKLSNFIRLNSKEVEKLVKSMQSSISPVSIIKCFSKAIRNIQDVLYDAKG